MYSRPRIEPLFLLLLRLVLPLRAQSWSPSGIPICKFGVIPGGPMNREFLDSNFRHSIRINASNRSDIGSVAIALTKPSSQDRSKDFDTFTSFRSPQHYLANADRPEAQATDGDGTGETTKPLSAPLNRPTPRTGSCVSG